MKRTFIEIAALLFVALLSLSLFAAFPREYPHSLSFKYAVEAKKAILSGGSSEPFYMLTQQVYRALGGAGDFGAADFVLFDRTIKYLPVALGFVSAIAFYLAMRTRLGPGMGALGAIFLVSSSSFLLNAMEGVYAPEIMSVALFSVSLAVFLSAGALKNTVAGAGIALIAGLVVGWNMTVTEAGALMAFMMVASAIAQFIYYVREKEYTAYGARVAALVLAIGVFLPYAKISDLGGQFNVQGAIVSYSFLLPLILLFIFVALRDLVHDTKRFEMFFLALAVGSCGVALFDPVAASPGMAAGAVFGAVAARDHLKEKWLSVVFVGASAASLLLPIAAGIVAPYGALAFSILAGVMVAVVFLLYEGETHRKLAVFSAITLLAGTALLSGALAAFGSYTTVDAGWGATLSWAKDNVPDDARIGAIGPDSFVEYIAARKGCCGPEVARYLLGGGSTKELLGAGADYIIVDKTYFDKIEDLASIGKTSKVGVGVYYFKGYYQDTQQKFYAYLLAHSGDALRIPLDNSGYPLRQDVTVDSVGPIPYGKIKRFDSDELQISYSTKVAIPLGNERNNLFDIYFDVPNGLELIHSENNGTIGVYRVT